MTCRTGLKSITTALITINPYRFFHHFLGGIYFDSSVLLDFLIGNETQFLEFLIDFLKYSTYYFDQWDKGANESSVPSINNILSSDELTEMVVVMSDLHYKIEKLNRRDLFPYNPTPLLRRISEFISKFHDLIE